MTQAVLAWPVAPSPAVVVAALARQTRGARRLGLTVRVDPAPTWLSVLLELAGLLAPDGPISVGPSVEDGRQAELREH